MPGEKTTNFLGCSVTKQHHTLTQIPMGLLKQEFELKAVEEAQPSEEMMEIPGMKDELRRPIMLLVKAQVKKKLIQKKSMIYFGSIKYEQSGVRTGLCPCPGEKGNR